jgi:hypothetical protein
MPRKDPALALGLELIGLVGVLGIGHIYAGKTGRGVALLIGWIAFWFAYWIVAIVLSLVCIGACMFPLGIVLWFLAPILSGLWIKSEVEKGNAMRRPYGP